MVKFQRFFSESFWPRAPIGPTAGARANQYFRHNSGSAAQNLDFFGSSVAESPCATFRSPEKLAETASAGRQVPGFWPVLGSPKKHKCPDPQNAPKRKKNRNSAKMRPIHRNFCSWTPPNDVLRLTGEQKIIRFWIDGPEIWPS